VLDWDVALYLRCRRLTPWARGLPSEVVGRAGAMRVISWLEDADQLDAAVAVGQKAARSIRRARIQD